MGIPSATQHGHCWSLSANPTIADSKTENGAGSVGAFTSAITGLTAGTLYHTRAYATNSYGTSYGEDVTFAFFTPMFGGGIAIKRTAHHYIDAYGQERYTVGTPIPQPTVFTQETTDIAPTTATGNSYITFIGDAAVTQHGHCWSLSAYPTTADSKTENGAGAVGAFTSAITGLTTETLYHTRAYATNAYGTSYGDDVEFTTT